MSIESTIQAAVEAAIRGAIRPDLLAPAGPVLPPVTPDHWYDLSDAATVFADAAGTTPATNGSNVARVADKAGSLALTATAGQEGQYLTAVENGLNILRAGNDNVCLRNNLAVAVPAPYCFVAVARVNSLATGQRNIFHMDVADNGNAVSMQNGPGYLGYNVQFSTVDTTALRVVGLQIQNGAHTGMVDGTDYGPLDINSYQMRDIIIGSGGAGAARMNFGELLVFNRALDAGERASTAAYLKAKWGTP